MCRDGHSASVALHHAQSLSGGTPLCHRGGRWAAIAVWPSIKALTQWQKGVIFAGFAALAAVAVIAKLQKSQHEKALEAERSKVRLLESQMHTLAAELEAQRDRVKDFDQLKSKYDKVVADMARVSEEKALADKQIQELVDRIKVAEEHAAQAAAESKQMRDKVAGVKVTGVQEHVNNDVPAVPASRTDIYDWVNLYKKDQLIHFAKVYGVDTRKGQTKMAIVDEIAKAIYSPTTGDE
ncbi:unnamed protein product [Vitrella brassicaformis CCMP3155]|uniref:Uncharacterized protein n=2 Tax=Vitrella brassicaformis TaxID=1169539 RepID=A0A0G4G205_VITBC|nr:unnamed protein product [Vitrella brassicaformis CCMP3155]|eukprot:CEM22000.1 unnamed protein product [Vitrella brassicaformis CCMP3155]